MVRFTHLHVHSHYSILDGLSKIPDLISTATASGMYAMALTDHGNMYGIKEFFDASNKYNGKIKDKIKDLQQQAAAATDEEKTKIEQDIAALSGQIFKPIFGCEAYVAKQTATNPEGSRKVVKGKENMSGYHLILLAKNEIGYKNLCKIISSGYTEGFYNHPRIDRELLQTYHEGLIVASACLAGELNRKIEVGDIEGAKESARWYQSVFGEDFYVEIQRHKTDKPNGKKDVYEKQSAQNPILISIANELGIDVIATNDVHFVKEADGEAHDRLICVSTNARFTAENRMRYTKQEWLKSPEEMYAIFSDVPQALENTMKIVDKVETYSLNQAPMMPAFEIPADFGTEESYHAKFSHEDLQSEFEPEPKDKGKIEKMGGYDKVYRVKLEADYLRKLTIDGARQRYGENIPPDVMERIDFELNTIKNMGFPGYFLIVQDFIAAARNMGVSVGPGRGSAAGSVVAYCLHITDIDPLKYDLLFERFLNPDRISLPDIDIDFDDKGRDSVLDWVTQKYGQEKVAHIITYGTMAAKSSIKDVARIQEYPLPEVNKIVGYIPAKLPEDPKTKKAPSVTVKNCLELVPELKKIMDTTTKYATSAEAQNAKDAATILQYASQLEGTIRQTGVHACGVIIGADDLTNHVPIGQITDDGKKINVTQYEGSVIESVGLIKMDFLGLRTLSIIKETIDIIKRSRGITIDIDSIPIDDEATYQLFSRGDTTGVFQFESDGMQKYLKELQPTKFEDLIAMNALYRPGPMDYIPSFIARKHGTEEIKYDIPVMEKYLKDTYGVTVYQEQVMLLSRLLANFTRGQSDNLRKAMGKKQIAKMLELKELFLEGGKANGHDQKILEKIWADWEKFASYAFNKSHATCYSWVAYQTAYLKAHYPAEFMAANLTNAKEVKDITKLIADCKQANVNVLGPDVNESDAYFTVNKHGEIRFGMASIKGVGETSAQDIINERDANGPYRSTIDFLQRINLRSCGKKTLESLAYAGAFDSLGDNHRAQFFDESKGSTFLEKMMKYATSYQQTKLMKQTTLFDSANEDNEDLIQFPDCQPWGSLEKMMKERDVTGFFISGHPLDDFSVEIKSFYRNNISEFSDIQNIKRFKDRPACIAGIVSHAEIKMTKRGDEFGVFTLEDKTGSHEFSLFKEDFLRFKHLCKANILLAMEVKAALGYNIDKERKDFGENVEDYRLKVVNATLLEEVLSKQATGITISLLSDEVTSEYVESLLTIVNNTKQKRDGGSVKLKIISFTYGESALMLGEKVDIARFCEQYMAVFSSKHLLLN